MLYLNGYQITPTIFPDKTSQVWKIPDDAFDRDLNTILWNFESEAEVFHLMQLRKLVPKDAICDLDVPYLPYARQDKEINNNFCFALRVFGDILNNLNFNRIRTIDVHSFTAKCVIENLYSKTPYLQIKNAFVETYSEVICYPDEGAADRYREFMSRNRIFSVFGTKKRDNLTGELKFSSISEHSAEIAGKNILIVDDMCDGGATFIALAKLLEELEVNEINLYVSHGIFSKGLDVLWKAGISRIFTKDGEVK